MQGVRRQTLGVAELMSDFVRGCRYAGVGGWVVEVEVGDGRVVVDTSTGHE